MGIQLMILAAVCIALSNLCMRKSIDKGGSTKAYLMMQLFLSFLIVILLNPVRTADYTWDPSMAVLGLLGGVLLSGVMTFLGKALEQGPPGLTIAVLNCSSVMPIFLLVAFFGAEFGFKYTLWNGIGSIIVVLGICLAGWKEGSMVSRKKWTAFIGLSFLAHVLYLVFLSWRALLIRFPQEGLIFSHADTQWFMPMVFLSACIVQTILFFSQEKRLPNNEECLYSVFGSLANGMGAFLMIKATEMATSVEHAMIFPVFSVTTIIVCNLWGRWLYQEEVNWKANSLCIGGLILGTVDWSALQAFFF